jgi:hypothetical protein
MLKRARIGQGAMCAVLIVEGALGTGCATVNHSSAQPSEIVATCIARGWERCGASGYKVPIVMQPMEGGYFVGFPSLSWYYSIPSGAEHSTYPVWAEVIQSETGSETRYRRAYQITHQCIDGVVRTCQQGPAR